MAKSVKYKIVRYYIDRSYIYYCTSFRGLGLEMQTVHLLRLEIEYFLRTAIARSVTIGCFTRLRAGRFSVS